MSSLQQTFTPRVILQLLLFVILVPFLPILIAWRWGWWEAWVYALIYVLGFAASRALAARRHPDLLAERARFADHAGAKAWDRVLAPATAVGGASILIVAGLDARFDWSPAFALLPKSVALLLIVAGYALVGSYALLANRFFSGMVRIQTERGHHVVSGGPYRWVRHPGYAGALLAYLATPVFLDSWWAFLPAVLLTATVILRTHLEDKTLREELPGYADYAGRVRYRLLPGIW